MAVWSPSTPLWVQSPETKDDNKMRMVTQRTSDGTRAIELAGETGRVYDAPDVGAYLADPARWSVVGEVDASSISEDSLAPLVPNPSKIVCLGLNYATHIREMGRDLPAYPTLFAKYQESLIGPRDLIDMPADLDSVDWEAELVVVVGSTVRSASRSEAEAAIAGFTVGNDMTDRGHQRRTLQWLQGKTWEASTPVGPALVTPDEVGGVTPDLQITAKVSGEVMQDARTGDLVFDPVHCVEYLSRIFTLRPGDLIFTGTPGGVGDARDPKRYVAPGEVVEIEIENLGKTVNRRAGGSADV